MESIHIHNDEMNDENIVTTSLYYPEIKVKLKTKKIMNYFFSGKALNFLS